MKVVHIAAEFAPIAKAGGLGEVLLGLSRELTSRFHDVEVILPKYSLMNANGCKSLSIRAADFRVTEKGQSISNTLWAAEAHGCRLTLIEAHHPQGYFHRDAIYGYPDDTVRFLYFCKAAVEYLASRGEPIDVLHLHDWHAAACAPLVRDLYGSRLRVKGILLTIHNLAYQGKCASRDLDAIGLPGSSYLHPEKLQDNHPAYPETVNLLKGGMVYADAVNTVSLSHAKEMLTPEMGFGLEATLQQSPPRGILNGIDATIWNPAADPHIACPFGAADSLEKLAKAKEKNKQFLEKQLSFRCRNRPLVGAITRLVPQKGTRLLQEAVEQTLQGNGSLALLGSPPLPEEKQSFDELKARYRDVPEVFLSYTYDDALAHQLYAALDFVLVPSLYEPCGLTQLIGLRYGALPIVRATGGLQDTVFDCEDFKVPIERRNGFVFREPTPEALSNCLQKALAFWHKDRGTYRSIARKAMQQDYSWKEPAAEYLRLYRTLVQ